MLFRSGDAIGVLEGLADSEDPELKLTSLKSLGRLYQFISNFDGSTDAMRKAMALVHFKHHEHDELFTKWVRLHERFGKLDDLEARLEAEASRPNPSEKGVFLMAEFYRLTANPIRQEQWAARLAEIAPGNADYQVDLVGIHRNNRSLGKRQRIVIDPKALYRHVVTSPQLNQVVGGRIDQVSSMAVNREPLDLGQCQL